MRFGGGIEPCVCAFTCASEHFRDKAESILAHPCQKWFPMCSLNIFWSPHHIFNLASCLKVRFVGDWWWGVMRKQVSDGVHWLFRYLLSPPLEFTLGACLLLLIFPLVRRACQYSFEDVHLVGRWVQRRGERQLGIRGKKPRSVYSKRSSWQV